MIYLIEIEKKSIDLPVRGDVSPAIWRFRSKAQMVTSMCSRLKVMISEPANNSPCCINYGESIKRQKVYTFFPHSLLHRFALSLHPVVSPFIFHQINLTSEWWIFLGLFYILFLCRVRAAYLSFSREREKERVVSHETSRLGCSHSVSVPLAVLVYSPFQLCASTSSRPWHQLYFSNSAVP